MLQVDPVKRPDISEIITDFESIALSKYVELKGSIVSILPMIYYFFVILCEAIFLSSIVSRRGVFSWSR